MIRTLRGRRNPGAPSLLAVTIDVNGDQHRLRIRPDETLLQVLRLRLGLTGTKPACERGECGACTVLVGGEPRLSCTTLAGVVTRPVLTSEGLGERSRRLRERFADRGGFQCGYCTPGQIVSATAVVESASPDDERALRHRMSGNICRCTGYSGIIAALRDSLEAPAAPGGAGGEGRR